MTFNRIIQLFTKYLTVCVLMSAFWGCSTGNSKEPAFDPKASLEEANEKFKDGYYEDARELFKEIKAKDGSRKYATIAKLRIADSYLDEELYDEAAVEYESFLSVHQYHKYSSYAQYKLAMSYFKRIETVDVSSSWARKALREFDKLRKNYPRNPYMDITESRIKACNRILAEYEFYVGNFYYKKGSYHAAAERFNGLLKDYPDTKKESETLLYLGLSYKKMGQNKESIDTFNLLINKFPTIELANEAREQMPDITAKE